MFILIICYTTSLVALFKLILILNFFIVAGFDHKE